MTKDEQIARLAEVVAEQQRKLNACDHDLEFLRDNLRESEQRLEELNREATELMRENKRIRFAMKAARYQLTAVDHRAFDRVFRANMGVKPCSKQS